MNIHPIVVHFPIALLTCYTGLEVLRFPRLTKAPWWFPVKAIMLWIGSIGGAFSIITGKIASEVYIGTSTQTLVELHEKFAFLTILVYGIISILYGLEWYRRFRASSPLARQGKVTFATSLLIIGSLLGFLLLTIVGALGGAIVYGPDVDPIVSVIYRFFFPQ